MLLLFAVAAAAVAGSCGIAAASASVLAFGLAFGLAYGLANGLAYRLANRFVLGLAFCLHDIFTVQTNLADRVVVL